MKPHANRSRGRHMGRATPLVLLALTLAACGGGSGDDGGSAAATTPVPAPAPTPAPATPAPTSAAEAINQQYDQVGAVNAAIKAIAAGDEAAHQALDDGRYADWDRYWTVDYPTLVAALKAASDALTLGESRIQTLVYGAPAATSGTDALQRDKALIEVAGFVLLVVSTVSFIVNGELQRAEEAKKPPTTVDRSDFEAQRAKYWESKGVPPVAARTRALAEATQISVLQGLKVGVDHGKDFAVDQVTKPAFTSYLPDALSNAIDVPEHLDKLSASNKNIRAILARKGCRTKVKKTAGLFGSAVHHDPESPTLEIKSGVTKADESCSIYVCSTSAQRCAGLPVGDWEAAIFLPGHLRDIDTDVPAAGGGVSRIEAAPVAIADIARPAPRASCSQTQNAGGDTPDSRVIALGANSGTFTFSHENYGIRDRITILYDGSTLYDTGCVSNGGTRSISFSGLSSYVTVRVTPNCAGNTSGTAWNYRLACPAS